MMRFDCALRGTNAAPLFAIGMITAAFGTWGQDLEPRTYANTPVGLNFLIAGYGYTQGGVTTDPGLPIENAQVRVHSGFLAYARSIEVFGNSAKFDLVLPYGSASGSATAFGEIRERSVSGLVDPRIQLSINLYGAPALSIEDFARYRQDTILGFSVQVTAPLGQYDADKLLNLGTNRWSIKPEIGISKAIGSLILELGTGVRFYTDNDNYLNGHLRKQKPIYSVQGHLIYSFEHGIWGAIDGTYYAGGRTTVDGVLDNNLQQNSRIGVTLALPIDRYNSLKLYYSTGVSTRTGSDFDALGIAWQTRFGGGY